MSVAAFDIQIDVPGEGNANADIAIVGEAPAPKNKRLAVHSSGHRGTY
jgi:hypothetical protein